MTRFVLPLAALVLLVGACSSTQSALNTQSVPAKPAGTVETRWGSMPAYTSDKGSPILLDPQGIPAPLRGYSMKLDLLVDRDGTVREVDVRKTTSMPDVDAAIAAKFKKARSRLVLAPSDPAPYVIRFSFDHRVEVADSDGNYNRDQYHFVDDRPMGQGQPLATDRP